MSTFCEFQDDEVVKESEKYKADGEYYPKILFLGKYSLSPQPLPQPQPQVLPKPQP